MNINDIMARDMAEAEREAPREIEARCDRIMSWICTTAIVLAALAAAFAAGMDYQARRDEKASREFSARCERIKLESAEAARCMSNAELLEKGGAQ